jgi:hypothetical protein
MLHFPIKSLLALLITVEIIVGLTVVAVRWPGIAAVLFLTLIGFRVLVKPDRFSSSRKRF